MAKTVTRDAVRKTDTLKRLDRMIETETRRLGGLESAYRMEAAQQRERIAELKATRDALEPRRKRQRRPASELDPHAQAGLDNVLRMEAVFARRRTISQADAVREARIASSGTGTWAIKALLADGKIEDTGEMEGVSRVYRWVGARRRTRVRAGS